MGMWLILSLHYTIGLLIEQRRRGEGGDVANTLITLYYWSPDRAKGEGGRWGCG